MTHVYILRRGQVESLLRKRTNPANSDDLLMGAMLVEVNASGKYAFNADTEILGEQFVVSFRGGQTDGYGLTHIVIVVSLVIALLIGGSIGYFCYSQLKYVLTAFSSNKKLMKKVFNMKVAMERPQQNKSAEGGMADSGTPPPHISLFLPHFRLYEVVSLHRCVRPYKYPYAQCGDLS